MEEKQIIDFIRGVSRNEVLREGLANNADCLLEGLPANVECVLRQLMPQLVRPQFAGPLLAEVTDFWVAAA